MFREVTVVFRQQCLGWESFQVSFNEQKQLNSEKVLSSSHGELKYQGRDILFGFRHQMKLKDKQPESKILRRTKNINKCCFCAVFCHLPSFDEPHWSLSSLFEVQERTVRTGLVLVTFWKWRKHKKETVRKLPFYDSHSFCTGIYASVVLF